MLSDTLREADHASKRRRWAPRVRTGCLVCRQRRIKCDETKPSCVKCTIGRFKCNGSGYGQDQARISQKTIVPRFKEPDYFVAPFAIKPHRNERYMFTLFREQIAPTLLDVFDQDFWAVAIPQASQVYPSVWHAVVATATLQNMRLIKENSLGDQLATEDPLYEYALKHCNMSLHHLRQIQPATATPADWEMVLLTCIVLICYSTLRGNFTEALTHIRNGFHLSNIWHSQGTSRRVSGSSRLRNCITTVNSIQLRFRRLESHTFLAPFQLSESAVQRCRASAILPNEPFTTTAEAYLELLSIDVSWKTFTRSELLASGNTVMQFIVDEFRTLRRPFKTWQNKFFALQRAWKPLNPTDANYRIENMHRLVLQLLNFTLEAMAMVDTNAGEIAWDEFNDNFKHMVDIVAYILKQQEREALHDDMPRLTQSLQFRSLIGLPMAAVGYLCRLPLLRTRAIALLKTIPFADGVFDSTFSLALIEGQQRVEEEGLLRAPLSKGCDCVQGKFICNSHRVCKLIMSPPTRDTLAKIRFRTIHDVENNEPGTEHIVPNKVTISPPTSTNR